MEFQRNVSLAPYTSLKIGGPADYFIEVRDRATLAEALVRAQRQGLRVTVLSGGTNVFVADRGIGGLVILIRLHGIREDGERFIVDAGTLMGAVVARSVEKGLAGLSWAGGLPGTVGGAVVGNAGTFGHSVSEVVEAVDCLMPDGAARMFTRKECGFDYRTSTFKEEYCEAIIVGATFVLIPGDREVLQREMREAIRFRTSHHPSPSSAGSFFKNPSMPPRANPDLLHAREDGEVKQWFGRIPAGWLIDRAGLKGTRIGDAMLSPQHANFVVNAGHATSEEVKTLATLVKDRVYERFGVILEEEVRFLE